MAIQMAFLDDFFDRGNFSKIFIFNAFLLTKVQKNFNNFKNAPSSTLSTNDPPYKNGNRKRDRKERRRSQFKTIRLFHLNPLSRHLHLNYQFLEMKRNWFNPQHSNFVPKIIFWKYEF